MNLVYQISGYIASVLLSIVLIPQIVQIVKTKSADDISYHFISIHLVMTFLYILYGIGIYQDTSFYVALPSFIGNTFSLLTMITMLILKIKFDNDDYQKSKEQ